MPLKSIRVLPVLAFVILCSAARAEDDNARLEPLRRFLASSETLDGADGSAASHLAGAALLRAARKGDSELFGAIEDQLRRLRRMPRLGETPEQREESIRIAYVRGVLIQAEYYNPDLMDFAEESLADPEVAAEFLREIVVGAPHRLRMEPAREVEADRVSDFLLRAAEHENERVRQAALMALTGCWSGPHDCEGEKGWNPPAAIPLLKRFANDRDRRLWERTAYIDWLISLDVEREHYLEVYEEYVADPEVEIHSRILVAEHLADVGYGEQETVDRLKAEAERMKAERERGKTSVSVIMGPDSRSKQK